VQKNLPFYPISRLYREQLGGRLRKIALNFADTCPNRLGLKGMKTCIFCDEWGSAAHPEQQGRPLAEQIRERFRVDGANYNTDRFLAYFQSYTSTFTGVSRLKEAYRVALSFPEIKGLIAGTRPDCLSPALLGIWKELAETTFTSVEFGVQSFFDHHLKFLERGHNAETSIKAIERVKNETGVHIGIHLIFGLPGETEAEIIETARIVSRLPVDSVKLHNLHVLKNTPLEDLYNRGEFTPIEMDVYAERAILFLRHLKPTVAIHRLAAMSNRWNELIAPQWTRHKMVSYQYIIDRMNNLGVRQGDLCH
jgi:radical SAM protein (TIGR01212 family)